MGKTQTYMVVHEKTTKYVVDVFPWAYIFIDCKLNFCLVFMMSEQPEQETVGIIINDTGIIFPDIFLYEFEEEYGADAYIPRELYDRYIKAIIELKSVIELLRKELDI